MNAQLTYFRIFISFAAIFLFACDDINNVSSLEEVDEQLPFVTLSEVLNQNPSFEKLKGEYVDKWADFNFESFASIDSLDAFHGKNSVKYSGERNPTNDKQDQFKFFVYQSWASHAVGDYRNKFRISSFIKVNSLPDGVSLKMILDGRPGIDVIAFELNGPIFDQDWKQFSFDFQQPNQKTQAGYFSTQIILDDSLKQRVYVDVNIDSITVQKHLD